MDIQLRAKYVGIFPMYAAMLVFKKEELVSMNKKIPKTV